MRTRSKTRVKSASQRIPKVNLQNNNVAEISVPADIIEDKMLDFGPSKVLELSHTDSTKNIQSTSECKSTLDNEESSPIRGIIDTESSRIDETDKEEEMLFFVDKKPSVSRGALVNLEVEDNETDLRYLEDLLFFEDKTPSKQEPSTEVLNDESQSFSEEEDPMVTKVSKGDEKEEIKIVQKKADVEKGPPGLDPGLNLDSYFTFYDNRVKLKMQSRTSQSVVTESAQSKLLRKSILTPDFEQKDAIPPYRVSLNKLRREKKKQRDSSSGKNWYNMSAVEMTEELKNDIKVTRMRSVLDPKRFYKSNDMTAMPKFVQVGSVVDSPVDFYHSRVPKRLRKQTIVEELLADAETRRKNKRKFAELQERFRKSASKRWRKRNKKR